MLNSQNPKRAQQYWDEAIGLLKEHEVIGHYEELDKPPRKRVGWQEHWLKHQRLEIKPDADGIRLVWELARQVAKAKRAVKRPSNYFTRTSPIHA
jgi:tRNA G37 N-methylase Trm5